MLHPASGTGLSIFLPFHEELVSVMQGEDHLRRYICVYTMRARRGAGLEHPDLVANRGASSFHDLR